MLKKLHRVSKYFWYSAVIIIPHVLEAGLEWDINYMLLWQCAMICLIAAEYDHSNKENLNNDKGKRQFQ